MKVNKQVLEKLPCREQLEHVFQQAKDISFGSIGRNQEGYIYKGHKLPRCTNILKMDGSKSEALMLWARRQVAGRAEQELMALWQNHPLSAEEIHKVCTNAINEPDRQLHIAANVGTDEHDNIEHWLFREPYKETDALKRFRIAWNKFEGMIIATEVPIAWVDEQTGLGFGGRLDMLIWKDGNIYIGDNKTSKTIHESYGCQVAGYKNAVEQMSGYNLNIQGGVIFHIPDFKVMNDKQKSEYEKHGSLVECKNLEAAFEHYRLLLGLYNCRNNKYF